MSLAVDSHCSDLLRFERVAAKPKPSGEEVQDLHVWWFATRCAKGRIAVTARTYAEVVADPRFRAQTQG